MLKWEGRLAEVMATEPDAVVNLHLHFLVAAHQLGLSATGSPHHARSMTRLQGERIELLGRMERFRDQGEATCRVANQLIMAGKNEEAAVYFQQARDIGAAHGFFSVESRACLGLGQQAIMEGRSEEGQDLLRNAFAAARLTENEGSSRDELYALSALINELFSFDEIDEVEPLVESYREAAKAESRRLGRLEDRELRSHLHTSRLHEVLRICNPLGVPPHCSGRAFHRGIAPATGCTTPARKLTHSLNLPDHKI